MLADGIAACRLRHAMMAQKMRLVMRQAYFRIRQCDGLDFVQEIRE
jgi:hypothetical protein